MSWFKVAEQIDALTGPIVKMTYRRRAGACVFATAHTPSIYVSYSETADDVRWQVVYGYDTLTTGIDKNLEAPGLISAIKNLK